MQNMARSKILSTGVYYPANIVTNKDLEKMMDTSDEWIVQRSGIKERRWVKEGAGDTTLHMAVQASKMALERANLKADDIDAIIFGALVTDYIFPGTGCLLQRELGFTRTVPALDIRNQCSGYLYALSVADAWIKSKMYKRVLIVASEIHSTSMDKSTKGRDISVLFGDAAAATILEACDESSSSYIIDTCIHSEGVYAEKLMMAKPSSNDFPRIKQDEAPGDSVLPFMDGKFVFKNAVTRMPEAINEILTRNKTELNQLDFFIPHQANLRINEMVRENLKLKPEQTHITLDRFGNTTMATIPLTLHEAMELGKVKKGQLVVLTAFGSGFTWGATLLRL